VVENAARRSGEVIEASSFLKKSSNMLVGPVYRPRNQASGQMDALTTVLAIHINWVNKFGSYNIVKLPFIRKFPFIKRIIASTVYMQELN
jgi:hypothetical protein